MESNKLVGELLQKTDVVRWQLPHSGLLLSLVDILTLKKLSGLPSMLKYITSKFFKCQVYKNFWVAWDCHIMDLPNRKILLRSLFSLWQKVLNEGCYLASWDPCDVGAVEVFELQLKQMAFEEYFMLNGESICIFPACAVLCSVV